MWFGQETLKISGFLLFVSYNLKSCEVCSWLAVNKLQFFHTVLAYYVQVKYYFYFLNLIGTICEMSLQLFTA